MRSAERLGEFGNDSVAPSLIAALKDESFRVREAAACALGRLAIASSADELASTLADGHTVVGVAAALALHRIGGQSLALLRAALSHALANVRIAAASALARHGDAEALDVLLLAVKAPDQRWRAMVALEYVQAPRAMEALCALVEDESVREQALYALGTTGAAKAFDILARVAFSDDKAAYAARQGLEKLATGWETTPNADRILPVLIAGLDTRNPTYAEEALLKAGARAFPALLEAVQTGSEHLSWSAAALLGRMPLSETTLDDLARVMARGGRADVRRAAAWAMRASGDARALPELLRLLPTGPFVELAVQAIATALRLSAAQVPERELEAITRLGRLVNAFTYEERGQVEEVRNDVSSIEIRDLAARELTKRGRAT